MSRADNRVLQEIIDALESLADDSADNNRQLILEAPDVVSTFTWSDFGLSTQRITSVAYASATVLAGHTATKTFAYTLVVDKYRLNTITWSYV